MSEPRGKQPGEATNTPEFMRLVASEGHLNIDEDDVRDEILGHIFDKGNPTPLRTLSFDISVSNTGRKVGNPLFGEKHVIEDWRKIGTIVFENAVGFHHFAYLGPKSAADLDQDFPARFEQAGHRVMDGSVKAQPVATGKKGLLRLVISHVGRQSVTFMVGDVRRVGNQ